MSAKSASRNLQVSTGLLSNYDDDDVFGQRALSPVGSPAGSMSAHVSIEMHNVPVISPQSTRSYTAKGHSQTDNGSYSTSSFTNDNNVISNEVSPSPGSNTDDAHHNPGQRSDTALNQQQLPSETRKSPDLYTVSTSPSDIDSLSQSIALPKSMSSRQSTDLELPLSTNSGNSSRSGSKSGASGSVIDESAYYCVDHMSLCSAQVRNGKNCIPHCNSISYCMCWYF